ncbi:hypothetical protein C5D44_02800 [Rathayibacter sp. AY1B5]|nr:hypothetical protein C5D44_02800 [Rathayibacter sp. AY1B5]
MTGALRTAIGTAAEVVPPPARSSTATRVAGPSSRETAQLQPPSGPAVVMQRGSPPPRSPICTWSPAVAVPVTVVAPVPRTAPEAGAVIARAAACAAGAASPETEATAASRISSRAAVRRGDRRSRGTGTAGEPPGTATSTPDFTMRPLHGGRGELSSAPHHCSRMYTIRRRRLSRSGESGGSGRALPREYTRRSDPEDSGMSEDEARGRDRREVRVEAARFDDPRELGGLLPPGLRIGLAQSAFQTEGSLETGGRGRSVWDDFALRRGTIAEEATPEIATDFLLRWREDLALLVDLGVDELRLSVSWPRLQPDGRGPIDRGGLGFYDRLLDGLAETGIRVALTLHHRDTPSALSGGWMNRDTAFRFGDLAFELGGRFGDRVADWITLDQPSTVMLEGYALARQAPGAGRLFSALPALHHQLLGHGVALEALRAAEVTGRIGLVDALAPVEPASDDDRDRAFASLADVLRNRLVADAVLTGSYPVGPEELPPFLGALAQADPVDLARISAPMDFYAVAPLPPLRIAAGRDPALPTGAGAPPALPFHTAPWPELDRTGDGSPVAPWAVVSVLRSLVERYGDTLPPLVVTALGASYPDEPDREGAIVDTERIRWLGAHLAALAEAVHDGLPVEAVQLWTLVDAFEWQHGYSRPHGLVAVDTRSRDRVPKASFDWLRRVLDARS